MSGVPDSAHRLDAMADVPSAIGRLTRALHDSSPHRRGTVEPEPQLWEGYPRWQIAPPVA